METTLQVHASLTFRFLHWTWVETTVKIAIGRMSSLAPNWSYEEFCPWIVPSPSMVTLSALTV
jgi:hypothetical protein